MQQSKLVIQVDEKDTLPYTVLERGEDGKALGKFGSSDDAILFMIAHDLRDAGQIRIERKDASLFNPTAEA